MHINFQQNLIDRSVRTVTQVYLQRRNLHKFATTNGNFEEIKYFRHATS